MPSLAEMFGMQQMQVPEHLQSIQDDASWKRADGTRKGMGFLGPLKFHDGRTSTEVSIGVPIGGREMEIPALVPTLTQPEIDYILKGGSLKQNAGPMADSIVQKATAHAQMRMQQKLPVFAP